MLRLATVGIEIEAERVVAEGHGRKGWLREGRRQLEQRRWREQRSIPQSRAERLLDAKQRLDVAHAVETAANIPIREPRQSGASTSGQLMTDLSARGGGTRYAQLSYRFITVRVL